MTKKTVSACSNSKQKTKNQQIALKNTVKKEIIKQTPETQNSQGRSMRSNNKNQIHLQQTQLPQKLAIPSTNVQRGKPINPSKLQRQAINERMKDTIRLYLKHRQNKQKLNSIEQNESLNERSQSISRKSSRSRSRNDLSHSVIMISSDSLSQHSQSPSRQSYKNSLPAEKDVSHEIELQNAPISSHFQDASSSPTNSDPEYSVQKIVSTVMTKNGEILYEVKWVGYPHEQNTFQPIKNLKNVLKMVAEFQQKLRVQNQTELKKEKALRAKDVRKLTDKDKRIEKMAEKIKELENIKKDWDKYQKLNCSKKEQKKQIKSQFIELQEIKLSESPVSIYQSQRKMNIIPMFELSIIPERALNQSSQKSEHLSTKNSQNQQTIFFEKSGYDREYLDLILNFSPKQIKSQYSQEIQQIDYFESNPIFHKKTEENQSSVDVSIDFMHSTEILKNRPGNPTQLDMILEEQDVAYSAHQENLIKIEQNQIQNLPKSSPIIEEFDCLDYFYNNQSRCI